MEGYIVHGGIGMARGSLARIADGQGLVVEVWDGEVWITQEGETRDYFIRAGESLRITRQGATLLYALKNAHVTLTAPVPAYYARRITLHATGEERARVVYDRANETGGLVAGLGHRLARFWVNAFQRDALPTTAAL